MERYTPDYEQSKVISLRLDKDKLMKLKTISKQLGTNRNQLINQAVDHYIAMLKQFRNV